MLCSCTGAQLKKATKVTTPVARVASEETIALTIKALFHGGDASSIALLPGCLAQFLSILAEEAAKINKCYNDRLIELQAAFAAR